MVHETYPYLFTNILLFPILLVCYVSYPKKRRFMMVLSGFLCVPSAFLNIIFVPEYWEPTRLFVFLIGPEDIIFSFIAGGITWFLATWWIKNTITLDLRLKHMTTQLFKIFPGSIPLIVLWLAGIGVMTSFLVTTCAFGMIVLRFRRDLWPISLIGMISFAIFHLTIVKIMFIICPEFIQQWNGDNLWGHFISGIPLEEIVWAATNGAVWPLLVSFIFDARISSD